MKFTVILSVLLIFLSELNAEDRQLYKCKFREKKELKFICEKRFNSISEQRAQCSVDESQPNYKCDGKNTPKNLTFHPDDFRGINKLNIQSLGIEHINVNEDKFQSESITDLYAGGNQLSSIPSSISMRNLQFIDFSRNNFTSITSAEFMGACGVIKLSFAHNQINALQSGVFSTLVQLQWLDLSHNSLQSIPQISFDQASNLEEINLSENQIEDIESGAFSTQKHLRKLDLSNNSLKSFNPSQFNELTHLNLEDNHLTSIEKVSPEKCPKLKVLAIARNNFTCEYLEGFLKPWRQKGKDLKFMKNEKEVQADIGNIDCHQEVETTISTLRSSTNGLASSTSSISSTLSSSSTSNASNTSITSIASTTPTISSAPSAPSASSAPSAPSDSASSTTSTTSTTTTPTTPTSSSAAPGPAQTTLRSAETSTQFGKFPPEKRSETPLGVDRRSKDDIQIVLSKDVFIYALLVIALLSIIINGVLGYKLWRIRSTLRTERPTIPSYIYHEPYRLIESEPVNDQSGSSGVLPRPDNNSPDSNDYISELQIEIEARRERERYYKNIYTSDEN